MLRLESSKKWNNKNEKKKFPMNCADISNLREKKVKKTQQPATTTSRDTKMINIEAVDNENEYDEI